MHMPDEIVSLIFAIAAITLLVFLFVKNKKDRKSFTLESTDDPVEEARTYQQMDLEKE